MGGENWHKNSKKAFLLGEQLVVAETPLQREMLEYLDAYPKIAWMRRYNSGEFRTRWGARIRAVRAPKGRKFKQLDMMGMVINGLLIAVEAKSKGEKPSHEQQQAIDEINHAGGIAFWADSMDSLKKQLDHRLSEIPDCISR